MFKRSPRWVIILLCMVFVLGVQLAPALSASVPSSGSRLPEFTLEAPASAEDRAYLGVGATEPFSIDQINCDLALIEIVGVYCPLCHIQMPLYNKLFYRIKKNADLYSRVKMVAVVVGATPIENSYFKKKHRIPYPVIKDAEFKIHKLLGEPRTPFIMLVSKDMKIVFTHKGIIKDMDKFLIKIRGLLK
jgi:hypothetical protein